MGAWAAVVVAGGDLSLWLQDAAEPPRSGREPAEWDRTPEPLDPDEDATPCPSADATEDDTVVLCVYATIR
ncbi:hypothetical protein GCM10027074_25750 [Streptomyces deserti]